VIPTVAPDTLSSRSGWRLFALALLITALVYWPGLHGGWLFDDYPNIVDNHGVQPDEVSLPSLVNAALSSPASDFKRPLASLSFAANYLLNGLEPFGWKLTNLVIHLCNGMLVFLLARSLLTLTREPAIGRTRIGTTAALIAGGWMLLPINLTAVLYVVQREESLANVFVLLGLIGYVSGRRRMTSRAPSPAHDTHNSDQNQAWGWLSLCIASVCIATLVGLGVKETAAMLPLYACLVECFVFRFEAPRGTKKDWRIIALFGLTLALPFVLGMIWLLPGVLDASSWVTRDFTLSTRLLSEARIVSSYLVWTLVPTANALSFYHDQFVVSQGWLAPWTTLASALFLLLLLLVIVWQRRQRPLVALGLALFLGAQLLTGTIVPLELVYEHRNYFASFGILLAVVPWLMGSPRQGPSEERHQLTVAATLAGSILLGILFVWWTAQTAYTAFAWGDPLALSRELADRGPDSPRAQYELGRTYIIYSHYDASSPYIQPAYQALEKAAAIPGSSILPQQALIFMNSRMGLPLKDAWWNSMIAKLKMRPAGVQDESSLGALTQCAKDGRCDLPLPRMTAAYQAALSHSRVSGRLLSMYADYSWNLLGNHNLGLSMMEAAVKASPQETAYRITQVRMLAGLGMTDRAKIALRELQSMNVGGRLDRSLASLSQLPGMQTTSP
jgi:protein O-mannosyl-transferase